MSSEVIKKTQNLLGKYVTKPPLSEKLLGKPPFRYLHDIINVVINDHGFLKGLLTDEELNSENIKDKDAKIAFLQKVIDATSLATQENLDVRPSKIVAGHDADKTNLLLQAIAKGIAKKIDSTAAVEQILSGGGKPQKSDKSKSSVKSKEAKPRIGSQGKDRKDGAKPKPSDSKPKPSDSKPKRREKDEKTERKSSKSRAGSRLELREEGKENDPPEGGEEEEKTDTLPNGNVAEEELPISMRPNSVRLRQGLLDDEAVGEEPMALEAEPEAEIEDEGLASSDELPNDLTLNLGTEDADNEGPNSLLQLNGGSLDDINLDTNESEPAEPLPTRHIPNDPLILKAMNRGDDALLEENGVNPNDSGVGSLESPKPSARVESLPNTAQSKSPRPVNDSPTPVSMPPTPGPGMRPISSYHPDLKMDGSMPASDDNNQELEQVERPRTGMGIRPRTGRKSARPASARPAPPKVRERKEIPQEEIPRPPTGKPVANVILDAETNGLDDDNDDEVFTVGNVETVIDDELSAGPSSSDPNLERNRQELLEGESDAKGILVAQILETKKELEDGRREAFSPETPGHRRVPIEQAFPQDPSKKKEKEMIQKDVEKLTSSIQALTRSVNPLAKMLDYLQEDLDSMQKELEMWTEENKTLNQTLKAEQSLTEQQQTPLKAQLEEMESAIFDQQDRISAVKSNIMRNDDRISRLMAGINLNS